MRNFPIISMERVHKHKDIGRIHQNQLGGERVAGEIYYNNRITAITSDYNYDRKNAQRNTKGKKKFSEILEEKTDTDRQETAQQSHIDVKY